MTPAERSEPRLGQAEPSTRHSGLLRTFCGHCGEEPEVSATRDESTRVCSRCGMGVYLTAPAATAPSPKDPFIVVDGSLTVCALSKEAERLLDLSETEAINRHITEFLAPGETDAPASGNLAELLTWAVRGEASPKDIVVRPANTFGVRYWARVGPCEPSNAALLVLADAR